MLNINTILMSGTRKYIESAFGEWQASSDKSATSDTFLGTQRFIDLIAVIAL